MPPEESVTSNPENAVNVGKKKISLGWLAAATLCGALLAAGGAWSSLNGRVSNNEKANADHETRISTIEHVDSERRISKLEQESAEMTTAINKINECLAGMKTTVDHIDRTVSNRNP